MPKGKCMFIQSSIQKVKRIIFRMCQIDGAMRNAAKIDTLLVGEFVLHLEFDGN